MIDIQFVRDNPDLVKEKSAQKGVDIDVDQLLGFDEKRLEMLRRVEGLRAERNELSSQAKGKKPNKEQIEQGKSLKKKLGGAEHQLATIQKQFNQLLQLVPNMHFDDVPEGGEEDSVEISRHGDCDKTGATDHLDLAEKRDWVDFERGAKIAGTKFYYLKGDLALLEQAIIQYALDTVVKNDFIFMSVPHLANARMVSGTGFSPRTSDQSDEYHIEGEDLSLIATAEVPLTGYHTNEIIDEADLPLKYAALSPCYRKEAGAYGKHARGLFRVHQFNKLEMYAFTLPENSEQMHKDLLAIEEKIWQELGLDYRVVNIAAGDLGAPAAKKYDIEYWSPVDGAFRELTSCSNCTDFQTRNLNIRVRREDGSIELLHSLNGTAVSLARSLVAIMEQYQAKDGKVSVPKALQKYMNNRKEI